MITVSLFRNKAQKIVRFSLSGHAGYAQSGADIVCASATTAAFTAVNGLTDIVKIKAMVEVDDGYLTCELPENLSEKQRESADLLLESMILSFENLAEQYGDFVVLKSYAE